MVSCRKLYCHAVGCIVAAAAVAAIAAVLGPASAAAAVGDCTPGADWGTTRSDLAAQVVDLINSHRSGMGLVALKVTPSLTSAAVWKARHMAEYQYMTHEDPAPPIARTVPERLAACGYPSSTTGWGENIAWGYQSAASVVTAWLNSPGHKANIENGTYRATGVGAAVSASGAVYWAQDFGTYIDRAIGGTGTSSPTIALTSGPATSTTSTSASFGWSTTGTVTSTTCSLDGAAAAACLSPKAYSGLAVGTHTIRVTVANTAGSASAAYTWSVTAVPPATAVPTVTVTSGPTGSTTATIASFGWSTTGTVTSTTCSLDGGGAVACASPRAYSALAAGTHTFRVTVSNSGGSATATRAWTVASTAISTAPTITITSAPWPYSAVARVAWTTTGTVTSTICSLDGGAAFSCASGVSVTVAAGAHRFTVTVIGPAGSRAATVFWTAYV
ncbi:MAG: CAP domain-containing protein [Gaiellaceae bacterium]